MNRVMAMLVVGLVAVVAVSLAYPADQVLAQQVQFEDPQQEVVADESLEAAETAHRGFGGFGGGFGRGGYGGGFGRGGYGGGYGGYGGYGGGYGGYGGHRGHHFG